jgi:2-keto-4-pentenoate hydratase
MCDVIRPKELIHLRRHGQRRRVSAGELPASIVAAYDLAAATLGLLGVPVAAWKLGATTAGTRRAFATDEIYFGGLLADEVWSAGASGLPPAPPLFRGEAEIAIRLAVDIAVEDSAAALACGGEALFDAWTPALEAPYSCVENIPEAGLRGLLLDRCSAGGLYLGTPRPDIHAADIGQTIQILVDGVSLGCGSAGTALLMPPLEAALGFLAVAAAQGVSVRRGQWISTGGITPCVPLPFDRPIRLEFGGQTVFELVVKVPAQ